MIFSHTSEQNRNNEIIRLYRSGSLVATATITHNLELINVAYNRGAGEKAENESLDYFDYCHPADLINHMESK